MKRTDLFVVFVLLFFVTFASAADIPGGIYYSDSKNVIFRNFQTGEIKNTTSGYESIKVSGPFAASPDGKTFIWHQDFKFWVMEFPLGVPKMVPINKAVPKKEPSGFVHYSEINDIIEPLLWQNPNNIKNMAVSPDGKYFSFDGETQDEGWVCIDPGDPKAFARLWAAGTYGNFRTSDPTKEDLRFDVLPLWVEKTDIFYGIFCLGTEKNRLVPPTEDPFKPTFGNTYKLCPAPMFKNVLSDPMSIKRPLGHGLMGFWREGQAENNLRIDSRINTKKNAAFLTYQKGGGNRAAFIYQIGNQWGPIEIKTIDEFGDFGAYRQVRTYESSPPKKYLLPRNLEIQISFPSVEGLAWMPDGSLTIFSQGKVFAINAKDILEAFNRSRTELVKQDDGGVAIRVSNNILVQPKLELVAQNVKGSCFNWVSNSSFLYLAPDNNVYIWMAGVTEKIADAIGPFCYCDKDPFEGTKIASAVGSNITSATGTITVSAENNRTFKVGAMEFFCYALSTEARITVKNRFSHQLSGGFVIPEETDLDKILDPSVYEYQTKLDGPDGKPTNLASLKLGQVIIFPVGTGSDYIGLKLLEVKTNPDFGNFSWKVWKGVQFQVNNPEKTKVKTWEDTLNNNGWEFSQKKFGEEFEIAGLKFIFQLPKVGGSIPRGGRINSFLLTWRAEAKAIAVAHAKASFKDLTECPKFIDSGEYRGGYYWSTEPKDWDTILFKVDDDKVVAIAPTKKEYGGMEFRSNYWNGNSISNLVTEKRSIFFSSSTEQTTSPVSPLDPQEWKIMAIPVSQKFQIGGLEFYWEHREEKIKEDKIIFSLNYSKTNKRDKNALEMVFFDPVNVDDPSKNIFKKPYNQKGSRIWLCSQKAPEDIVPFNFRLGQEYFLVAPIEKRTNPEGIEWIQFRMKHWPVETSLVELAKLEPPVLQ